MSKDDQDTMAEVSDQIQSPDVIPGYSGSRRTARYPLLDTLLFVALCTSSLSASCAFMCMNSQPFSEHMEPIATYVRDMIPESIFNAEVLESSELYIWGSVAVFWVSLMARILQKRHDATYVATPISLSVMLTYAVGFTVKEYMVVVLPLILSLWELLSDR